MVQTGVLGTLVAGLAVAVARALALALALGGESQTRIVPCVASCRVWMLYLCLGCPMFVGINANFCVFFWSLCFLRRYSSQLW